MEYGRLFCEIAHRSLLREETELDQLNRKNPSARPMSVSQAAEVTIQYLITKEAMRHEIAPRIFGEVGYEHLDGSRKKTVDICFTRPQGVCASFELKIVEKRKEF